MAREVTYYHTVSCRLDDADAEAFESQAASAGLTKSQYLRYLIRLPDDVQARGGAALVMDNRSISAMRRELVRWGHHYNQGVHALNSIKFAAEHKGIERDYFDEQIGIARLQLEEARSGAARVSEAIDGLARMPRVRA